MYESSQWTSLEGSIEAKIPKAKANALIESIKQIYSISERNRKNGEEESSIAAMF